MNLSAHEHNLPDAELVLRAQRGSRAAFAELVSRYQDRIYNTCYRMCHNEADAADLTQATFLRALQSLPRFERRAQFYTWLFRIAINLTMSRRRAAYRRPPVALEGTGEDEELRTSLAAEKDCDPTGPLEEQELRQRVESALEQLDDEFRAAVVLKDIEEMDYASIAEILGVPVGTVKSRIHRGRLMLRELLRDERVPVGQPRT